MVGEEHGNENRILSRMTQSDTPLSVERLKAMNLAPMSLKDSFRASAKARRLP